MCTARSTHDPEYDISRRWPLGSSVNRGNPPPPPPPPGSPRPTLFNLLRLISKHPLYAVLLSLFCSSQTGEALEESNSCVGFFADAVFGDGEPFSALALEEPAPL
jgi:hypothetical protein